MRIVAVLNAPAEVARFAALGAGALLAPVAGFTAGRPEAYPPSAFANLARQTHAAGLLLYAGFETIVHEAALPALRTAVRTIGTVADALVVADAAAIEVAAAYGLVTKVIYAPGTFNSNAYDAVYYRKRGLKGITLSREITRAQILAIARDATGIELSLVGHGHLPMFASRRRFLSDYASFRDRMVPAGAALTLEEEERPGRYYPFLEDDSGTTLYRDMKRSGYADLAVLEPLLHDFFVDRRFLPDDEYDAAFAAYADPMKIPAFLSAYGAGYDSGFADLKTAPSGGDGP